MGKNNKKRKRAHQLAQNHFLASSSSSNKMMEGESDRPPADDDEVGSSRISDSDLEITIRTLQTISSQLLHHHHAEDDDDDDDNNDDAMGQNGSTSEKTEAATATASVKSKSSVLAGKRFKELRKVLHPLVVERCRSYQNGTDYRIKVTQHLTSNRWSPALTALQACRDFVQLPKQGTIQRWVRDVDLAPSSCKLQLLNAILLLNKNSNNNDDDNHQQQHQQPPSKQEDMNGDDHSNAVNINKHDPKVAIANHLESLKRRDKPNGAEEGEAAGGGSTNDSGDLAAATGSTLSSSSSPKMVDGLTILPDWSLGRLMNATAATTTGKNNNSNKDWDEGLPPVPDQLESRIIYSEPAAERTPPNHYDLLLHTTNAGFIKWDDNPTTIQKHPVPFLEDQKGDAFLLERVLSIHECQQLRAIAAHLGFRPDHPTALDQPTGIDSCEWMVDDSILRVMNDRVRPFLREATTLLSESSSGNNDTSTTTTSFFSINPRWRFFRYGQGCVYRPHIDGSWPASRITPDGNYECYSSSPEDDKNDNDNDDDDDNDNDGHHHDQDSRGRSVHLSSSSTATSIIKSYHTFLIYLNDNFEGGQTRFFFPGVSDAADGASGAGSLCAQGVTPQCGSVLVFSQGNTASLLHEGSAVTKGTKFVVRTDVLYRRTTTTFDGTAPATAKNGSRTNNHNHNRKKMKRQRR